MRLEVCIQQSCYPHSVTLYQQDRYIIHSFSVSCLLSRYAYTLLQFRILVSI